MSGEAQSLAGEWHRTSPLGVVARAAAYLRSAAIPLLATLYSLRDNWNGWGGIAAGVIAVLALFFALAWVDWRYRRYCIGSDDIRVERGLLSRHARSVPYERIQDVSLEEALVPRLLGLVEVRFETGAGGGDEVVLSYVSRRQGEALRETVKARRAAESVSGAQVGDEAEEAERLFAMDPPRLLTFGLFEFSLVVFAVLAGLVQQLDFLLPFDPWDADRWRGMLAGPGEWLAQLGIAAQFVGGLLAAFALALVGLATGIVRTVLRDWDFRLDRTPKGLRRRRGLLTRTDVVMPLHRVQALTIATGAMRRFFGWYSLSIVSLGRDSGAASHVAVPFGRMDEIARVAAVTGFRMPDHGTHWHRTSARYRLHSAVIGALLPLLAGVAAILTGPFWPDRGASPWPIGPALMLLGLALGLRQIFLWRHHLHGMDSRQLYVRGGWLVPKLQIASRQKLHSVEIAQGPLARRGGYAHLHLGVAGGALKINGIPLSEATGLRRRLLSDMAAVDLSRLGGAGHNAGPAPSGQYIRP